MQRTLFLILLLLFPVGTLFSQFESGFDKERALQLVRICNSFTYIDLFGADEEILPKGYEKIYTSGAHGMDNKFQVYRKGDVGVIHFRGSTAERISWLENINASMIPAQDTIKVHGRPFEYRFATDEGAAVHSGYALGIAFLHEDILFHIKNLNRQGVYDLIITGHSQGGALANLTMAYLSMLPEEELSPKNRFKTYSFAAPMVGDETFAKEYRRRYASKGMSYNLVNPKDPVPKLPLRYHQNGEEFLSKNLRKFRSDEEDLKMQELVKEGASLLFKDGLKKLVKKMGKRTDEQIEKEVGSFDLPPHVEEVDYHPLPERKLFQPLEYPKILKDSSILRKDSLVAEKERGANGHLQDESLYEDEPWAYQHRSYNYYLAFLKTYFPQKAKGTETRSELMQRRK